MYRVLPCMIRCDFRLLRGSVNPGGALGGGGFLLPKVGGRQKSASKPPWTRTPVHTLPTHATAAVPCRSFVTFEQLPLVEFELEPGVGDEEAARVLGEDSGIEAARWVGGKQSLPSHVCAQHQHRGRASQHVCTQHRHKTDPGLPLCSHMPPSITVCLTHVTCDMCPFSHPTTGRGVGCLVG